MKTQPPLAVTAAPAATPLTSSAPPPPFAGEKLARVRVDDSFWPTVYTPIEGVGPVKDAAKGFATLEAARTHVIKTFGFDDKDANRIDQERPPVVAILKHDNVFLPIETESKLGGTGGYSSEIEADIGEPYGIRDYSETINYRSVNPEVVAVIDSTGKDVPFRGNYGAWARFKDRAEHTKYGLVYPK